MVQGGRPWRSTSRSHYLSGTVCYSKYTTLYVCIHSNHMLRTHIGCSTYTQKNGASHETNGSGIYTYTVQCNTKHPRLWHLCQHIAFICIIMIGWFDDALCSVWELTGITSTLILGITCNGRMFWSQVCFSSRPSEVSTCYVCQSVKVTHPQQQGSPPPLWEHTQVQVCINS